MHKQMVKLAYLKKCADWGSVPWAIAALFAAGAFGAGALGGVALGKLSEPGDYDKENLQKEYELARLNRDNQTQRILGERQDAERAMRQRPVKPMRIG